MGKWKLFSVKPTDQSESAVLKKICDFYRSVCNLDIADNSAAPDNSGATTHRSHKEKAMKTTTDIRSGAIPFVDIGG